MQEEDRTFASCSNLYRSTKEDSKVQKRRKTKALKDRGQWLIKRGLRDRQEELHENLKQTSDLRKVLCYTDPIGGAGKSYFTDFMVDLYPQKVLTMDCGNSADMYSITSKIENQESYVMCQRLSNSMLT